MSQITLKMPYFEMSGELVPITYVDGTPGVQLMTDEGPVTLSINLAACGIAPEPGNVILKDYSEGEGASDALVRAGAAVKVRTHAVGNWGSTCTEVTLV